MLDSLTRGRPSLGGRTSTGGRTLSAAVASLVTVGLVIGLVSPGVVVAAPCCGGGSALPSLITGDQAAQVGVSSSFGSVIGDAPVEGLPVFRPQNTADRTYTTTIDVAKLVSDSWQLGFSVPVVTRQVSEPGVRENFTGIGDARAVLGYEVLPELEYSEWKPRGFGFLSVTTPTGRSIHEAEKNLAVDSTGAGRFVVSLGASFQKKFATIDWVLIPEVHFSPTRQLTSRNQVNTRLGSQAGGSALFGLGASPEVLGLGGSVRFGLRVQPVLDSGFTVAEDGIEAITSRKLVFNAGADLGYLINQDWSASLSYNDQTLLGPVSNTTLSRSLGLAIQKRFER